MNNKITYHFRQKRRLGKIKQKVHNTQCEERSGKMNDLSAIQSFQIDQIQSCLTMSADFSNLY